MTAYLVDVHHLTHTCPASPEPHIYDTRRTIIAVNPGGPCQQPISVGLNGTTVTVACGRRIPTDRQCRACKTIVVERSITVTFTGHHSPQPPAPIPGIAA